MEPERLVEGHGVKHVDGQQGYGADALDWLSLRFHSVPALQEVATQGAGETAHSKGNGSSWRGVPDYRVKGTPEVPICARRL
jgi:hypothetical protein